MTGMMPEQMIRPASGFSLGVHIRAAEEKRLDHQMLQFEFAGFDFLMDPLMAGIEAPGVSAHRDEAGFFLHGENPLCVGDRVCNRNLDFNVLSGPHTLD